MSHSGRQRVPVTPKAQPLTLIRSHPPTVELLLLLLLLLLLCIMLLLLLLLAQLRLPDR
jgi:hypothetical protein